MERVRKPQEVGRTIAQEKIESVSLFVYFQCGLYQTIQANAISMIPCPKKQSMVSLSMTIKIL